MTPEIPMPNGLRGRIRPGRPWQRFDVRQLRLARLVADLEAEATSWPEGEAVHVAVSSSASALRTAAQSLTDPD